MIGSFDGTLALGQQLKNAENMLILVRFSAPKVGCLT
jgi:hypothetical protein